MNPFKMGNLPQWIKMIVRGGMPVKQEKNNRSIRKTTDAINAIKRKAFEAGLAVFCK